MDLAPRDVPAETSPRSWPQGLILARAVCLLAFGFFVLHAVWVIAGPERRIMDWLYDDCFYYLIVAAHFSRTHVSTFDGVTLTTGYHPLWMWLCAGIFHLHNRLDLTYVRLCMTLSAAITGGLLAAGMVAALRRRSAGWLWALALAATSYSALNNGASTMEFPLVVASWAALHLLLLRQSRGTNKGNAALMVVLAVCIGIAGSLSRTDFGLVPLAYLAGALLARRALGSLRPAILAAAALAGGAAGVLLTFVYDHAMTGMWIQQSAEIKRLLASVSSPFNPAPALWQFARVLLYLPPLSSAYAARVRMAHGGAAGVLIAVALIAVIVSGAAMAVRRGWRPSVRDDGSFMRYSAICGILAYAIFYSFNSQATYGWYTATVTGFVLVLAAQLLGTVPASRAAIIVLPLMCLNLVAMLLGGPTSRAQYAEVIIGKQMHADHSDAVMGGGDVGKPSFFNGGGLINTDGLMNNEILPYLKEGKFPCYILRRRIAYQSDISEISILITDKIRKRKHLAPVPWRTDFQSVPVRLPGGGTTEYFRTDFEAIRDSGECPAAQNNPVP